MCKMDKKFFWALLVPMERRALSAPIDSSGQHLWRLTVGQKPLGGEREGLVGVLGPVQPHPLSPPPPTTTTF